MPLTQCWCVALLLRCWQQLLAGMVRPFTCCHWRTPPPAAGGINEQTYVRLRSEAKAPFRLTRIIFLGGLAVGAALGLFIIAGRLLAALAGDHGLRWTLSIAWQASVVVLAHLLQLFAVTSDRAAGRHGLTQRTLPHAMLQAARVRPTSRRRCRTLASTRQRWQCWASLCECSRGPGWLTTLQPAATQLWPVLPCSPHVLLRR